MYLKGDTFNCDLQRCDFIVAYLAFLPYLFPFEDDAAQKWCIELD